MRGSLVVGVSLALVGCPKDPPPGVSEGGATTLAETSSSSSSSPPTGGGGSSSGATTEPPTTAIVEQTSTSSGSTTAAGSSGEASSGGETSGDAGGTSSGSSGDGDSTTGPPPRLFDCYGCECDANEYYCQQVFNGVLRAAAGDERRLCPVVDPDTPDNGCVPYPTFCEGTPSCQCLPQMNGTCFCTEVEAGVFEVVCPLP